MYDTTILNDHYLNWLRFANPGMIDNGNIIALDHAIKHMPTQGAIIEIGTFCGLSTNIITHLQRRHNRTHQPLITCDPWQFEGADTPDTPMSNSGITFGEYRKHILQTCKQNLQAFSRNQLPCTIETTSNTFFHHWQNHHTQTDIFHRTIQLGGPIALAYIDGDHRYEQVKQDFQNVHTHLQPHGFILFDDSADNSQWEVCQLMQEIQNEIPQYKLIHKYPNHLYQKQP